MVKQIKEKNEKRILDIVDNLTSNYEKRIDTKTQRIVLSNLEKIAIDPNTKTSHLLKITRQIPILNRAIILAEKHNDELDNRDDAPTHDKNGHCLSCGHKQKTDTELYDCYQIYLLCQIQFFGIVALDIHNHGYNRLSRIIDILHEQLEHNKTAAMSNDFKSLRSGSSFYGLGYLKNDKSDIGDKETFLQILAKVFQDEDKGGGPCYYCCPDKKPDDIKTDIDTGLQIANRYQIPPS